MAQVRYFFRADKPLAEAAYTALEQLAEDEGAPLAIIEIDEARDIHEVSAYLEPETEDRSAEFRLAAGLDSSAEIGREELPEIDWMAEVLAGLKPVRAGRFLVHGSHDRAKVLPGDIAIEIEAAQAFGTGHHGTTAGCLEMIEAIVRRRRPRNVLDLGTGSAVLAIGAAKLARVPVLATDIDPVAVRVARTNIAGNGVRRLVRAEVAIGFAAPAIRLRRPFELIVANILAGPLMAMAPDFERHLAAGGDIILSGILARQRQGVLAAFRQQHLFHRRTILRGEWVTLHLSR